MTELLNILILATIFSIVFYGLLRHFRSLTKNPVKFLRVAGYVGLAIGAGLALLFLITMLEDIVNSFPR